MRHHVKVARLKEIPGIGVERMGSRADSAHDPEILRLENLDTDILPPHEAIDVTRHAIGEDINNSYLPFVGQEDLREAATRRVARIAKTEYNWQKECIISAGGMSGILNCFLATLEPGDEVIVTDPVYAGIINRLRLASAIPIFVTLIPTSDGWRLDLQALTKAVTSRTRMLVISPGMPSGHILNSEEWNTVCTLCKKEDLWLLYDAAMERILYDGREVIHPASFGGMKERTITVGAASKELRMIGWRVGWIVGPESIMNDIGLVSIANVVCQCGISMKGVAHALNMADDGLNDALATWQRRRDILCNELSWAPITKPHGGWSLLLDAEQLGYTAEVVVDKLFIDAKVAATAMTGWGEQAKKYVRLVFSNESADRLRGIGNKIKMALC